MVPGAEFLGGFEGSFEVNLSQSPRTIKNQTPKKPRLMTRTPTDHKITTSGSLSLLTWNINSVRLRMPLMQRLIKAHTPDVICLQEIKCTSEQFPLEVFKALGYPHIALNGQKAYHGVAIISRLPFVRSFSECFGGTIEARHIAVLFAGMHGPCTVHNFYVPAGGDTPDSTINDKFATKLAYLDDMTTWFAARSRQSNKHMILTGDLNIAPLEHDVWNHKALLRVVSHTPEETTRLETLRQTRSWVDVMRHFTPEDKKLYTWWSYRAQDWKTSDRGRRLDHIWVTPPLKTCVSSVKVLKNARGWVKASDHAPVLTHFAHAGLLSNPATS